MLRFLWKGETRIQIQKIVVHTAFGAFGVVLVGVGELWWASSLSSSSRSDQAIVLFLRTSGQSGGITVSHPGSAVVPFNYGQGIREKRSVLRGLEGWRPVWRLVQSGGASLLLPLLLLSLLLLLFLLQPRHRCFSFCGSHTAGPTIVGPRRPGRPPQGRHGVADRGMGKRAGRCWLVLLVLLVCRRSSIVRAAARVVAPTADTSTMVHDGRIGWLDGWMTAVVEAWETGRPKKEYVYTEGVMFLFRGH